MRSFGKFLCRQGILAENPAKGLRGPRLDKKLPHFLTLDDVQKLLGAPAEQDWSGSRDRAILETLYSAGIRVSELVGLNLLDMDLADGVMTVRGKGKKERLALLGPGVPDRAIAAGSTTGTTYWRSLGKDSPAVFLNKTGGRLTTRSVGRLLTKHLKICRAGPADKPAHDPTQLRDTHARCRGRHPRSAGTPRPQEFDDNASIHTRDDPAAPTELPEGAPEIVTVVPDSLPVLASRGLLHACFRVPARRPAPARDGCRSGFRNECHCRRSGDWRTDYNLARKEAAERGVPVFLVIGTENCFYCRKLEAGPFRDPLIIAQLTHNFVPLKIDANKEPNLTKALKVQLYPTIVLAGPDGKIHAFIEGFLETNRLDDQLRQAINSTTTTDWDARDFEQSTKALAVGDYPRAVSLLRGIIKESGEKPVGVKAKQVLDEVEKVAATRLARAKALEQRGFTQEAVDTLAEVVKAYAGTQTAADAATLMTGLAATPEIQDKLRLRSARDLLAAAREAFRANKFFDCLQRCDQLTIAFAELPEAKEAASMAADIRGNPERLALVCDQMNQRTATMYLTLAESWVKKHQAAEAIACYEKVSRLCPNTRQAEIATAQITQLRANGATSPAALVKP